MISDNKKIEPMADSSYGLVFRMNWLWEIVDRRFMAGKLESANIVLDRIYCNLMYRDQMDYVMNDNGDIVKIRITNQEKKIKKFFDKKIAKCRENIANSKSRAEYKKAHADFYQVLLMKDVWLRKFMQSLKLYMRENRHNPGSALFGGGSR